MSEMKFDVALTSGVIKVDFEAAEREVVAKASGYNGAIFTEESKGFAKTVVADLRAYRKNIDDIRKTIKTEYMKPYDDFKARVDGLLQIIDRSIDQINNQIKEMEETRIAKKKAEIQALYDEIIGEMREYIPLNKIYDPKWENASVKMPTVKKSMIGVIKSVYEAVTTIQNMSSESVPKALEMYKRDLSLANAVTYINTYETQRLEILRKEEEKKRNLEIERIREEERRRIAEEQQIREDTRRETVEALKRVDEEKAAVYTQFSEPAKTKRVIYTVVGTETELEELETALNSLGLYFERKDV